MNASTSESDWFWMCSRCGVDTPYRLQGRRERKGYTAFWEKAEDTQIREELSDFFYQKYPKFKS